MKDKLKKYSKGFTLVELIIVITILAVLATIAFISFNGYTKKSRDGNRIITIGNIKKGMELYFLKTNKYPEPDGNISSGFINNKSLVYKGEIQDLISKKINLNTIPKDPLSGDYYTYGTDINYKYFQIATTLENIQANNFFIQKTYANLGFQAKVDGNYSKLLKVGNTIYNLPSLIYTGNNDLLSSSSFFIIDKGENLPYKISGTTPNNNVSTNQILKILTGKEEISLTGVTITDWNTNSGLISEKLGYTIENIGISYFGENYIKNIINDKSNLIPLENETENNTTIICNGGEHIDIDGQSCISNTRSCIIENGIGEEIWNGENWGNCNIKECNSGFSNINNSCIKIGTDINNPGLSCKDILSKGGGITNGVYWIDPDGTNSTHSAFQVYCDMTSDGGGWTLVVGVSSVNRNHINTGSVTPSNLISITGKGKFDDTIIRLIYTETYKLDAGGSNVAYFKTDSFGSKKYVNSYSPTLKSSCTYTGNYLNSAGSSDQLGLSTLGNTTCGGGYVIYSTDLASYNGCRGGGAGRSSNCNLWVK